MTYVLIIVVAVAVAVVLLFAGVRAYVAKAAERRLVARVGSARAASLIAFETEKVPGIKRGEAAQRALERWEYDQTR
jgi:uncharacterized membrane protein YqiK